MTRQDVYKRLNNVFREVLDDESIELHDETVPDDIDGWDSFEHINLIVGIEKEFAFKIPVERAVLLKNVGDMVDVILEMGK
ncbi:acyl carrier protein [Butyrivibrio sp. AC2005]|uniref:acyl carrier protein n=1 Tax=Butyrivibrio sp. AC2005 TaxID=1280672 RepID=UPI000421D72D|nr:acyl carrier protein [Butyrivibrio sp. AC2005]